jgi:hypothetical protein
MNDCQFELLDIIENILVIESNCTDGNSLKVVNFSSDSKVIKNYSWAKLMDMKKENESIQVDACFGSTTQVVSKPFYNVLVSNPEITVEQFKELVDKNFMKK